VGLDRGQQFGVPDTGFGQVGGTLKLIYTNSIDGNSSTGIGIDLGYLYRDLIVDRLDAGVKLQDATGTYLSWSTGRNEYIWPMLKVGLAYTIVSEAMRGSLLLALDSDFYFDNLEVSVISTTASITTPCEGPVAIESETWGSLKALYR